MRRIRAIATGRVQGVGYRVSAQRDAERLGLAGWVRNVGADRVEIDAQGDAESIEELISWLRQGPPLARVAELRVEERTPDASRGFEVRPSA
ncbi:acylphosphatase [Microbacterium sp. gxy059]|uniref:acylphosphatase n=1 Tax=uncultured bacterium WT8 TaxID=1393214 RepID=U3PZ55_9BACT|nr:Wt8.31c [uncultured bacterium WT8]